MTNDMVLIDAFSQIFRSFFAIRQLLTNSRGEPTNALYVFTRLLLKIEADYPSDCGALLFDCGKPAFRTELNAEYKANRPPMPDELRRQLPVIREMAEAFGWPLLEEKDYEADDLIGAFARHTDRPVRIVSSDKDLGQLICDRVTMLVPAPQNGFSVRDKAACLEKFAVPPELLVDYLAIIGDNSDNIPGVNGLGPKGAADLLNTYGAIDSWIDRIGETFGDTKYGKKLSGNESLLKKNQKLIQLRTELPERFSDPEEHLVRRQPDWQKIRSICERMELKSILKDLPPPAELQDSQEETEEEPDLFSFMTASPAVPAAPAAPEKGKDIEEMEQGLLF
jgi:DNA polymerase-1